MDMQTGLACSNCETIKQTANDELLLLRTSFVEYKKRVICTDKLFKQLTAKRSQVTKVEGKLSEASKTLSEVQEQLKSALINQSLTVEKCKSLDLELANVTAERDKELCDLLTVQQQKAALEDKLNNISQKHQNIQLESAEKIKKLEGKVKSLDQNSLVKLKAKLAAQGLELTMLRQELEDQSSECQRMKLELDTCKLNSHETLKDTLKQQDSELSSLRLELNEKHTEIKSLKETLAKANESNTQVQSFIDQLGRKEAECLLLREVVLDKHNEIELLTQKIDSPNEAENQKVKLKTQENEILLLRQKLKEHSAINNDVEKVEVTTSNTETQTNLHEEDSKTTLLNSEVQNLRKQLEALKLEFDINNSEKLTQLGDKENEMLLLRKELELQRQDLEDAKRKLEASEKETTMTVEENISEKYITSRALSSEEAVTSSAEIAALKLQLSTLQSDVDMKAEEIVQLKITNVAAHISEHLPKTIANSDPVTKVESVNDEEIATLKLQVLALEQEVELKTKEIEELTNSTKELLSQSKPSLDTAGASLVTAADITAHNDEIAAMKLQLSNLQTEVDLKAMEIRKMQEKEVKDARRHDDLIEKGRLAEARTFELVAELAQLKTRDDGKNSASQKCTQLEKILALRDTQIAQLKAELKGVLASRRREPRKPSGARSASSGRGSCETSDLDDSSTLADLSDPEAELDVGEILRLMTAVPAMVAPIEAVARPVSQPIARPVARAVVPIMPLPIATPAPYEPPPERVMQEKMLLALVQSVRSATESYEKLYGTSVAASAPILGAPVLQKPSTSCIQPVGNTVSSFTVVNDWIKNVSPEIGADQRSFSDGFGSAPSSKGSVRELNVMQDTAMPTRQIQYGERSRELSASFSGRRVQGRAGMSLLPREVVALSRRLKSPLKSRTQSSDLDRVRKSVAMANKADHFVQSKEPTMAALCANLGVDVPSKFTETTDNCSTSYNTNKRTSRFQVRNDTKGTLEGGSLTTRKTTAKKKIPPISTSFVQGMIAPNLSTPTELRNMENAKMKSTRSSSAITSTIAKSECVVTKMKKKRKAKEAILFGSDDDQPSPTKMQCAGDSSSFYSDDEISIVSVFNVDPCCSKSTLPNKRKLVHLSSFDNEKTQPSKTLATAQTVLVKNSHSPNPTVSNSLAPLEMSKILDNVHSPTDVRVLNACDEKKTTAPSVPEVIADACEVENSAPTNENDCEMPIIESPRDNIENPVDNNKDTSEIMPVAPMNQDHATESETHGANVGSNHNVDALDEKVDPALASDAKTENNVSEMETTDNEAKDDPEAGDPAITDATVEEIALTQSQTTSDLAATEEAVNCKEVKLSPAQKLEDDDSDCELVIADSADQISLSDETDSSVDDDEPLRVSISVQTDPKVESLEYDSDDEPLSSLLSNASRTSFPASVKKPLKSAESTPTIDPTVTSLPICVLTPLSPSEIKRPFFYKAPEEAADMKLQETLDVSGSSQQEPAIEDKVPAPPPRPKLKDETGVWNRRIYATLAENETFSLAAEEQVEGDTRKKPLSTLADKEAFSDSQEEQVEGSTKKKPVGQYLRLILNKFLCSRTPLEEALDKTMKNMTDLPDICIANQMIAQATRDISELEPKVSGEMQTTSNVRKLIMMTVALHELKPMLTDLLLTQIERRICHLSYKPPMDVMQRLLSLHLGVCLRLRLSERQRTLLYDILYCFTGESMIPVCSHILETAPFSLKHAFMGQDDIVSLTVAYALQFGKSQMPHENKTLPLLVTKQYKYDKKRLPSAPQLIEKMVLLLKDGDTDFVEACLVLLCKRLGWECANSLVLYPMRRVVERWEYCGMPLCAAVIALRVIAFVVRTIPKAETDLADKLFKYVSELLRCDKQEIHEHVLRSLMMMAREKHFSTVVALLQNYEGTSSEEFTAAATVYIAKVASWQPKRIRKPPERYTPVKVGKPPERNTPVKVGKPPERNTPVKVGKQAGVKEKPKAKSDTKLKIKAIKNLAKKKKQYLRRRAQKSVPE